MAKLESERFIAADALTGFALSCGMIADWLEDRARLLKGFDDFGAIELAFCAAAVREGRLLLGGIIDCDGQPYPTNGGERVG